MCGIWGIVYGPKGPEAEEWTPEEFAQIMFPAITHRGPHAWGWMSYSGGDSLNVRKFVGRADTKRAIKQMNVDPDAKWVVGHVRFATHGDPTNLLNNHPILHGNIVGVHNGIIRNHADILAQTGRENPATEVDSEAIFAAIDKWGHEAGLNKLRGDMVSVYVDRRYPLTVRIARFNGRPLLLSRTPTGALIFASEEGVMDATGIERTDGSPVLPYRLLNVKEGKITKRVNLNPFNPAQESSDERVSVTRVGERGRPMQTYRPHAWDARLSPQANTMRQRIIELCLEDEAKAAGTSMHRIESVVRTPAQNQKVQPNGTMLGDLYWYNGMLYDLDTYMDMVLGENA